MGAGEESCNTVQTESILDMHTVCILGRGASFWCEGLHVSGSNREIGAGMREGEPGYGCARASVINLVMLMHTPLTEQRPAAHPLPNETSWYCCDQQILIESALA